MSDYVIRGDSKLRREFTEAHCAHLARWFDKAGAFRRHGTPPATRERLWNCFSLLAHGDPRYARLAEQIILATPIDNDSFEPIAAVELALRFRSVLPPRVLEHLKEIVRRHFTNLVDVRFAGEGVQNFSCMTTWFLLAAGRVLDRYEHDHSLRLIPEVYSSGRIHAIGMNALRVLAYENGRAPISAEFNSPTYTTISLMALAKIADLIDDPEARETALKIEGDLWRETLGFYHPFLGLSCGPYSRAYRVDLLGQTSQARLLLCYTGVSNDQSLLELLAENEPGHIFHHDGDIPFTWSGIAWHVSGRYHVPTAALRALRDRNFPKRIDAPIHWPRWGNLNPKTKVMVSVHGDLLPAGQGRAVQVRQRRWALGWRTLSRHAHSFPMHLHYPLMAKGAPRLPRDMRDVRNVVVGVVFYGAPVEWVPDQEGKPMEASNFNNAGPVRVTEVFGGLDFEARPFAEMGPIPADEVSVNAMIPVHFAPITHVALNGKSFEGQSVSVMTAHATCRVQDAGFEYEMQYRFPRRVEVRLYRWANFIRLAGFWRQGRRRAMAPSELRRMTCRGSLRIIAVPSSCQ